MAKSRRKGRMREVSGIQIIREFAPGIAIIGVNVDRISTTMLADLP
jgi:hypothetical protein